MKQNTSVTINNCDLHGIDIKKRTQSLRSILTGRGSISGINIPILNKINLFFQAGERIAFIGKNGSGKSSILKLISNIYPPSSGDVKINGTIVSIIEMGLGIEPDFTGRQNIKILMLYNNTLNNYNKEIEEKIINFSELKEKIDLPINTYSSGMISRLSFSVSIFQNSDILLLDEIFAAGDGRFVDKSLKFMKEKIHATPIVILVSHQEQIIREYCNRAILMKSGNIIADGNPDEILSLYNSQSYQ